MKNARTEAALSPGVLWAWMGILVLTGSVLLNMGCGEPVEMAGVRYRSFGNTGGNEIYLGIPDLGLAGNRLEVGYVWGTGPHNVTFTYDPENDLLHAAVEGPNGAASLDFPDLSARAPSGECTLGKMNSVQVIVADRDAYSQVDFLDVELDGFRVGPGSFVGDSTFHAYQYFSLYVRDGFTLTGTIVLGGPFSVSQESSKVEIDVGCNL